MENGEQCLFTEETMSTIEAMKKQEVKYACCDCSQLHRDAQNRRTLQEDRRLMLKWSYNVVDFFNLDRETAAIAMNYSDRFLQTDVGFKFLQDTQKYQLLCIVSLYLAVKIHEPASLTPQTFVDISRGQYGADDMIAMETLLLATLKWRVNPPTSLSFVRNYLDLIPPALMDRGMRTTAYLLARAQTERALQDYGLVTVDASEIAHASVLNALQGLGYNDCLRHWAATSTKLFSKQFLEEELEEVRFRLCNASSWDNGRLSLKGSGSGGASKNAGASLAARASTRSTIRDSVREHITPRSVACHALSC